MQTRRTTREGFPAFFLKEPSTMEDTPSTVGAILFLGVTFLVCLLWAKYGHTADSDPEKGDAPAPGQTS
jgi:hypothetical protein